MLAHWIVLDVLLWIYAKERWFNWTVTAKLNINDREFALPSMESRSWTYLSIGITYNSHQAMSRRPCSSFVFKSTQAVNFM